MILWILILIMSGLGGWLYRRGGTSKGTLWRDLGVPCVSIATCLLIGIKFNLVPFLLHFGLLFGALTTYRYFLPKPIDYDWRHYGLHGLFTGLAAIPLIWCGVHWYSIVLRAIVLAGFMAVWSIVISWDNLEEGGRGGSIIASLPMFLI